MTRNDVHFESLGQPRQLLLDLLRPRERPIIDKLIGAPFLTKLVRLERRVDVEHGHEVALLHAELPLAHLGAVLAPQRRDEHVLHLHHGQNRDDLQ